MQLLSQRVDPALWCASGAERFCLCPRACIFDGSCECDSCHEISKDAGYNDRFDGVGRRSPVWWAFVQ